MCGGVRVKRVEWEKRQLQTQVDRLEHDLHSLSTAQVSPLTPITNLAV